MSKPPALRITINQDLALQCQDVLQAQGVPLNVTQAVNSMIAFAVQTKTKDAAMTAKGNNDGHKSDR
jgi:hypothetical protein